LFQESANLLFTGTARRASPATVLTGAPVWLTNVLLAGTARRTLCVCVCVYIYIYTYIYIHTRVTSAQVQLIYMAPCPFEEVPTCYPHRIKLLHLSILQRIAYS
jgi:hypothetical protein